MTWTLPATFALNSLPTASDMNTYVRDNLRNLYGIEAAQTVTQREKIVYATAFRHDGSVAEFRGAYTADGVAFRVLGENHDTPSALTTGHQSRLLFGVSERDGGTLEKLARIESERTSAAGGGGSLALDTYYLDVFGAQVPHAAPAISIDEDNHVGINKTGGAYALNVGGSLRAAGYKQAGAGVGKWVLAGTAMTYAGNARVTGTWSAGADAGIGAEVASTTVCTNLNAEKMRGKAWPTAVLQGAPAAGISLPAGYGYIELTTVKTITAVDAGWHLLTARLQVPISNSGHLSGAFGIMLPGLATPADPSPAAAGGVAVGSTVQVWAVSRYRATAGEVLTMQAYNTTEAPVVVLGHVTACWLSSAIDIYPASFGAAITFGTPTLTVV